MKKLLAPTLLRYLIATNHLNHLEQDYKIIVRQLNQVNYFTSHYETLCIDHKKKNVKLLLFQLFDCNYMQHLNKLFHILSN